MGLKRTAVVCITTSFAVHAAAVVQFATPQDSLAAAGPPPALVTAGNSFADMVMGAPATRLPDPVTPDRPVETVSSIAPQAAPVPTPPVAETITASITLDPAQISDHVAEIQASTTESVEVQQAQPVENAPPISPVQPGVTAPAERDVQQSVPVQTASAPAVERLEPQEEALSQDAPQAAPRPAARPTDLARTRPPQTPPVQQVAIAPEPAPASGSAAQDATRGADVATQDEGEQVASGQGNQPDEVAVAGAAQAAAGYPNQVMRTITRTRRDRTRARGVTLVSFDIGSAGQLISVEVARSSGSSDLDRIATNHIQRSAPFPTPPQGARTSYFFEFEGRR